MDLNCGCPTPTQTRMLENGIFEQSFDNGETWTPVPDDPRFTGSILPQNPISAASACNGARAAREALKLILDDILNDADIWAAVGSLVGGICGALVGTTWVVGAYVCIAISLAAVAIITIGRAVIQAELDTAAYDCLECIFFCHVSDSGLFTEAGWQAVKQDLDAEDCMGLGARKFVYSILEALGPVGLTNLARSNQLAVGDCDECPCEVCDINRVYLYNFQSAQWVKQTAASENTVILHSTQTLDFNRPAVRFAFGTPYPNGGCCDITSLQQISGNQIFIVETINCADEIGSAALPPTGCWKQQTIFGNVNDEVEQVWELTLGAEC